MSAAPQTRPSYERPNTLAARLGLHPETIRKAIRNGDLKVVRLGKRALAIDTAESERWLASLQERAQ